MSDVQAILTRARDLGLHLSVEGDRIAISPARQCPPDLLTEFREHKPAVIALLAEARSAGLAPDCAPWLHVAKQVFAGEFDGCDSSTRQSLTIGLRSIQHSLCEQALSQLKTAIKQQP